MVNLELQSAVSKIAGVIFQRHGKEKGGAYPWLTGKPIGGKMEGRSKKAQNGQAFGKE